MLGGNAASLPSPPHLLLFTSPADTPSEDVLVDHVPVPVEWILLRDAPPLDL
jgi:hypothetical protein